MIRFDHYAITTKDLDKTIDFYEKIGFKVDNVFNDCNYRWASLSGPSLLEIFECCKGEKINHVAYSFECTSEVKQFIGEQKPFYGDKQQESYFIKDDNDNEIQFIKKIKI